jgi:hypothetical protein
LEEKSQKAKGYNLGHKTPYYQNIKEHKTQMAKSFSSVKPHKANILAQIPKGAF